EPLYAAAPPTSCIPVFPYASYPIDEPTFTASYYHILTIRFNNQGTAARALSFCTTPQQVQVSRKHISESATNFILNLFVAVIERNKTIETLAFKGLRSFPSMALEFLSFEKNNAPLAAHGIDRYCPNCVASTLVMFPGDNNFAEFMR
ncbi:hypothetical protein BGX20_004383, partial [Mortierella sp. AD010]